MSSHNPGKQIAVTPCSNGKEFYEAITVTEKKKTETKALKILWWKHWVEQLQQSWGSCALSLRCYMTTFLAPF